MVYLSVLIPAYNEKTSILETINKIKSVFSPLVCDYEIIVINDGSKDGTKEVLSKIKDINIINNPYNLGYGASLKKGLCVAQGEYIIITDADGTYPIGDIPKLLKYHTQYDMVVGARIGKNVNIPLLRRPAKKILTGLANLMSERKILDLNSGFRIFRKDMALKFYRLYPSGFSFTSTITLAALTNEYTVKYIPIDYFKRTGKSTISPIKDFIRFIALIFKITLYFNPLKFFLIPGIVMLIGGVIYGVYQILNVTTGLGKLPIILILGGMQICFLGIFADMISKRI